MNIEEQELITEERSFWEATDDELIAISEHINNELLRFDNPDLNRIGNLLRCHSFDEFVRATLAMDVDRFSETYDRATVIKDAISQVFKPSGKPQELVRVRTRAFIAFKAVILNTQNEAEMKTKNPNGKEYDRKYLKVLVMSVKEIRRQYLVNKGNAISYEEQQEKIALSRRD